MVEAPEVEALGQMQLELVELYTHALSVLFGLVLLSSLLSLLLLFILTNAKLLKVGNKSKQHSQNTKKLELTLCTKNIPL